MNFENFPAFACRSSESRSVTSQIYLFLLVFNGWYHENLANRQLICVICEKYRKSPVLIAGTLYLKILSGASKKLRTKCPSAENIYFKACLPLFSTTSYLTLAIVGNEMRRAPQRNLAYWPRCIITQMSW